jgi:hypothetical protein
MAVSIVLGDDTIDLVTPCEPEPSVVDVEPEQEPSVIDLEPEEEPSVVDLVTPSDEEDTKPIE